MAATVILSVILILILLVIAIFSVNLNIVISFYFSSEYKELYKYAVRINRLVRFDSDKKNKKKKSSPQKIRKKLFNNLKKYRKYIALHNVSFTGQISFGNAYNTAMASGILSGLAGIIISILSSYAEKISVSRINICPVYEEKINVEVLFECIACLNTGNIIVESLKILKGSSKNGKSHK